MFWGSKHLLKAFENINSRMSSNTNVSWPKFKYLDGKIEGNLTKTRTLGLDDFNVIHSLGYKSDYHITTDTTQNNITRQEVGYKGFIGNVHASDGYTYYLPAYSTSLGKLERSTGKITLENKFSIVPQVRSGAEGANGIIYMPSYTKTLKIYTYNTKTGEVGLITPPQPGYYGHVWGAAADKNGNVYMPPALSKKILKIDTQGEVSILQGGPVTSGVSGFDVKYVGATYVESVNKVFCLPRCGKKILVINCADDSYEEIDLPADYLAVANKNKNFHGYLAPDGWLYSAFWADTKCFRINPNTYEIQWKDYSEEFMDGKDTIEEASGIMNIGTGFTTAAITVGDSVYFGLAGTSKAVKLEFEPSVAKLSKPINNGMSEIKINSNDLTPGIRNLMGALLATDGDKEITITISNEDVQAAPIPSPSLVCPTPMASPSPSYSCANYCTCSNCYCPTTTCYCSCNVCTSWCPTNTCCCC